MTTRPAPTVTDSSRDFWEKGSVQELRIARCEDCRTWHHPPPLVCPRCLSGHIVGRRSAGAVLSIRLPSIATSGPAARVALRVGADRAGRTARTPVA
ncbi:zinc ribbon domain-containing protein [Mycobacterium sp. 852002-51971_SCH5477799-a]|uniref:zinc ribbon domain-containing protein n=1 Tax=Mycobacterium sp. 852002-51971_SCH5477799-a TaxID=1834106 RepID=UPI0009ECC5BD